MENLLLASNLRHFTLIPLPDLLMIHEKYSNRPGNLLFPIFHTTHQLIGLPNSSSAEEQACISESAFSRRFSGLTIVIMIKFLHNL